MRVYTDTSVFGGPFDKEFESASCEFFKQVRNGKFKLCISDVVRQELVDAPNDVKAFFDEMLEYCEILPITVECLELRDYYISHKIVTPKSLDDALHVATASVHLCDIIVSWNFKHIVHYDKIKLYNAVNQIYGHREIFINSPSGVIYYEE
jgi:predicted nucleic acid-binding protein